MRTWFAREISEAKIGYFVGEMNAKPQSPSAKRVGDLIVLLQEADDLKCKLWKEIEPMAGAPFKDGRIIYAPGLSKRFGARDSILPINAFSDPALQSLNHNLCDRLARIDRRLRKYRWTPAVRYGGSFLEYVTKWPTEAEWENRTVLDLLESLKGQGLNTSQIQRYRRCRLCSNWFYAVTAHQKNCSDTCRKKFNSNSDKFRAKRASYMRERYRPLLKELQENSKKTAKKVLRQRG
jgi:predicted nucleic acid-binding Zn ribbon protein